MSHVHNHRTGTPMIGSRPDTSLQARQEDLVQIDGKPVHKKAAEVFQEMKAAAAKDGVDLQVVSGYRSDAEQAEVYAKYGPGRAAPPGSSTHRTGLAIDIGPPAAYDWLAQNAKNFGFAKTVQSEPWHYELTGVTNGGEATDYSGDGESSGGGSATAGDSASVGGGGSPSGLSLGGASGGGSAGGASGGGASGGGSAGGAAASGGTTPAPGGGSAVPAGNFAALMEKLRAMGIDEAYLKELAEKYGVPVEMILAVMMQESGGNPNAKSPVGAMGLMQLMPGTAAGLGVGNPMDPKQNLEGGVKYLGQMLKQFGGDQTKALAAYNAGPGNVQKYGGVPPFAETQKYVANITASMDNAGSALA